MCIFALASLQNDSFLCAICFVAGRCSFPMLTPSAFETTCKSKSCSDTKNIAIDSPSRFFRSPFTINATTLTKKKPDKKQLRDKDVRQAKVAWNTMTQTSSGALDDAFLDLTTPKNTWTCQLLRTPTPLRIPPHSTHFTKEKVGLPPEHGLTCDQSRQSSCSRQPSVCSATRNTNLVKQTDVYRRPKREKCNVQIKIEFDSDEDSADSVEFLDREDCDLSPESYRKEKDRAPAGHQVAQTISDTAIDSEDFFFSVENMLPPLSPVDEFDHALLRLKKSPIIALHSSKLPQL